MSHHFHELEERRRREVGEGEWSALRGAGWCFGYEEFKER
jgi:hypothetical protein